MGYTPWGVCWQGEHYCLVYHTSMLSSDKEVQFEELLQLVETTPLLSPREAGGHGAHRGGPGGALPPQLGAEQRPEAAADHWARGLETNAGWLVTKGTKSLCSA